MNTQDNIESMYLLRSGITIFNTQNDAMDQLISQLTQTIPAKLMLVTDITGQILAAAGDRGTINLVALGTLLASDIAASKEVARITGEYQDGQIILREGHDYTTFLLEAGPHLILFAQIPNDVPLGWGRLNMCKAANKLEKVVSVYTEEEIDIDDIVVDDVDLPDLIGEKLNELWGK